jgi:hypothetical protein
MRHKMKEHIGSSDCGAKGGHSRSHGQGQEQRAHQIQDQTIIGGDTKHSQTCGAMEEESYKLACWWIDAEARTSHTPRDAFTANPPLAPAAMRRASPGTPKEWDCVEVGHLPKRRWGSSHTPDVVLLSHISRNPHGKDQQLSTRREDEAP